MPEEDVRERIKKIDALREEAANAERMHTRWMYSNTELVVDQTVTVKRRVIGGTKEVHSEIVMSLEERELFRDWLEAHARRLREKADKLAAEL